MEEPDEKWPKRGQSGWGGKKADGSETLPIAQPAAIMVPMGEMKELEKTKKYIILGFHNLQDVKNATTSKTSTWT